MRLISDSNRAGIMWHNPLKLHTSAYCSSLTLENLNNIMQFIETMLSYIVLLCIKTGTFCKHDTGWFELLIAHMTCICVLYALYNVCAVIWNCTEYGVIVKDLWQEKLKKMKNKWKRSNVDKICQTVIWTTSQHTVPFEDSFMLKRSEIQRKIQELTEYNQIFSENLLIHQMILVGN